LTKEKYIPLTEEEEIQKAMEESLKDSASTVSTTTNEQTDPIEQAKVTAAVETPKI
jgi:hypothetical protein